MTQLGRPHAGRFGRVMRETLTEGIATMRSIREIEHDILNAKVLGDTLREYWLRQELAIWWAPYRLPMGSKFQAFEEWQQSL